MAGRAARERHAAGPLPHHAFPPDPGHRALARPARDRLLACIAHLIEDAHGGTITKRYLTELRIAYRLAG